MKANETRKLLGIFPGATVTVGTEDLTSAGWHMRPALQGEVLKVFDDKPTAAAHWRPLPAEEAAAIPAGTWVRRTFSTPKLHDEGATLLLNATGMSRGQVRSTARRKM